MTHTYAILEISRAAYDEVAAKLREAGYDHVFGAEEIDMHGIALAPLEEPGLRMEELLSLAAAGDGPLPLPPIDGLDNLLSVDARQWLAHEQRTFDELVEARSVALQKMYRLTGTESYVEPPKCDENERWEPNGDLGNSEAHVRRAPVEKLAIVLRIAIGWIDKGQVAETKALLETMLRPGSIVAVDGLSEEEAAKVMAEVRRPDAFIKHQERPGRGMMELVPLDATCRCTSPIANIRREGRCEKGKQCPCRCHGVRP